MCVSYWLNVIRVTPPLLSLHPETVLPSGLTLGLTAFGLESVPLVSNRTVPVLEVDKTVTNSYK